MAFTWPHGVTYASLSNLFFLPVLAKRKFNGLTAPQFVLKIYRTLKYTKHSMCQESNIYSRHSDVLPLILYQ